MGDCFIPFGPLPLIGQEPRWLFFYPSLQRYLIFYLKIMSALSVMKFELVWWQAIEYFSVNLSYFSAHLTFSTFAQVCYCNRYFVFCTESAVKAFQYKTFLIWNGYCETKCITVGKIRESHIIILIFRQFWWVILLFGVYNFVFIEIN